MSASCILDVKDSVKSILSLYASDPLHMVIEITAIVLAIFALYLAIVTELKVRKIRDSADHISSSAEYIRESLSTKYVGAFPDNMIEITKLVSATKKRLTIMCDIPSFGHYSSPQNFELYDLALHSLVASPNKPKITLITYSSKKRLENAKSQFYKEFKDIEQSENFKRYFEYHKDNSNIKYPRSTEEFYTMLEDKREGFMEELKSRGIKVLEYDDDLRIFAWISDDSAIFSFYNYGSELREVSFSTHDQAFFKILNDIADNLKSKAREFVIPTNTN